MARLTLQDTMDRLTLLIRAGYPVIYIVSHEETRVLDYLARIYRVIKADSPQKNLLRWYEGTGFEQLNPAAGAHPKQAQYQWLHLEGLPGGLNDLWGHKGGGNPLDALHTIRDAKYEGNPTYGDSLTVFFDLHPELAAYQGISGALVRPLRNAADSMRRYYDEPHGDGEHHYKTIVIVAPSAAQLSPELDRDLIVVDFPLPEEDELRLTLAKFLTGRAGMGTGVLRFPDAVPADDAAELFGSSECTLVQYKDRLCDLIAGAGRGLTLDDYTRGLSMFAVSGQCLHAGHVEDMLHLKAKAITNDALEYTPHVKIELGGLDEVKRWVRLRREAAVSESVRHEFHLPAPKGVMLCGASGGGKSELAKLIAKEFNLALLRLDVGALFGMYVGESEERTRRALKLAEVLAPVVLWLDEVDKAFAGVGATGDNGVSARVFGHFLTWLAEKEDSVFVVATANKFDTMLNRFPEFGRKGRFDEIFWVGLPDREARKAIFGIYLPPHCVDNYFKVTDEEVSELAAANSLPVPQGGDALDRFCALLAEPNVSGRKTGAEIKYAVQGALYEAYGDARQGKPKGLTPRLVLEVVKRQAALYGENTDDTTTLNNLRTIAENKGWRQAGHEEV